MVEIQNAVYTYDGGDDNGLRGINISIRKGECILLTGESGCGKTTATRLINGLIPHFYEGNLDGQAMVSGFNVSETATEQLARIVGSVFQNPRSQFFNLDTTSEIAFGCENMGLSPPEIRERVRNTAKLLGIEHLLDRDIFALSGGEKQLVAIASVYASDPDVLVFDEPSSNLDGSASRELARLIGILKMSGKTIIIAEHRIYYLAGLYDRVLYMEDGRIKYEWKADVFHAMPNDERVRLGLRAVSLNTLAVSSAQESVSGATLEVSGLTASYKRGKPLFENLSFSAVSGKVVALIGKNGQGKTTLGRVLCGLHRESAGTVMLNGKKLPYSKRCGHFYLVMQESSYQLFTDSVGNELRLSKSPRDKPSDEKVKNILQLLSLTTLSERHPMSLSGGERQRTAIGVAMAQNTGVLIFDEPTSGLDYKNMLRVAEMIRTLKKQGKIIFIITHDIELLAQVCTRAIVLGNGKIAADLPVADETLETLKKHLD